MDVCTEQSEEVSDSSSEEHSFEIADSLESDVSRYINEESLLNSVFEFCDMEKTGRVPVSRLIEYIRCTSSVSNEEASIEKLDNLSLLMDPTGKDVAIDYETYRRAIGEWIVDIRLKSSSEEDYEDASSYLPSAEASSNLQQQPACARCVLLYSSTPFRSNGPARIRQTSASSYPQNGLYRRSSKDLLNNSHLSEIDHSYGSLEASGCEGNMTRDEEEMSDLHRELTDLRVKNKQLQEKQNLLVQQVDDAEEGLVQANAKLQEQIQKNASLLQTIERMKALEKENEELKLNTLKYQEAQEKLHVYEAKMKQIQSQSEEYKCKFNEADLQNQTLKNKIQALKREHMKDELQVQTVMRKLGINNATLKKKISKLEKQIMNLQQTCSFRNSGSGDGLLEDDDYEEAMKSCNILSLTSIQDELKLILHSTVDSYLPLPLCEKEDEAVREEMVSDIDWCSEDLDQELQDIFDTIPGLSAKLEQTSSQTLLEEKKHSLLRRISHLISLTSGKQSCDDTVYTGTMIQQELDEIVTTASEKQKLEDKLKKLISAMRKLKAFMEQREANYKQTFALLIEKEHSIEWTTEEHVSNMEMQIKELNKKLQSEQDNKHKVSYQYSQAQTRLQLLIRDVDNLTSQLSSATKEKRQLTDQLNNSLSEVNECKVKLDDSVKEVCELKQDKCYINSELERATRELNKLSESMKTMKNEHIRLQVKHKHSQVQTEKYCEKLRLYSAENSELCDAVCRYKKEVGMVNQNLRSSTHYSSALDCKLKHCISQISDINGKLSHMSEEKLSLQQKLEVIMEEKSQLNDQLEQCMAEAEELNTRAVSSREELFQLSCRYHWCKNEYNRLQKALEKTENERNDLKKVIAAVQELKSIQDKQITQLERANVELAEKYQKSEASKNEIKEELRKTKGKLLNERSKSDELEESITLTKLQLQLDPKEIWRLVQKEIENECLSDSGQNVNGTTGTVSADSVLEHSSKQEEIATLKSRLACRNHLVHALVDAMSSKVSRQNQKDCSYKWKSEDDTGGPSSPLVEALTLHDFLNANHSCRTQKQTSASADSILDSRRPQQDNVLSTDYLASSCPALAAANRHVLVTNATQTELAVDGTGHHQQTTPVHHRLCNVQGNISSSSSTSGAVDLDFGCSTIIKADTYPRRREGVKSVHIVEAAHCSYLDVDDSSTVRRNSFKRAIERGQSLESSQSFEAEPGSGETTPDRTDHIPVITTLHKDSAGLNEIGFTVHSAQTSSSVNSGAECAESLCHHPPEYYVACERSRSLNASKTTLTHQVLEDKPVLKLPRWGDTCEYFEDHKGDFQSSSGIHLDMNTKEVYDSQGVVNMAQDGSRRLSTLVEEGSDAEAEESVTNPSPPVTLKSSAFPFTPQSQPPQYKSPPAYKEALEERLVVTRSDSDPVRHAPRLSEQDSVQRADTDPSSQTLSPHNTQPTNTNSVSSPCLVSKSALKSRDPPPYPRSPRLSPASCRTRFADDINDSSQAASAGRNAAEVKQSRVSNLTMPSMDSCAPQRESSLSPKAASKEEHRPLSPARIKRRHLLEESKKKKDAALEDLLKSDLEETDLSEADKETNAHLIEEAKRASSRHKIRRRRSSGSASPGSGPDLTRSQSFDEGTEDVSAVPTEDVFKSHGSTKNQTEDLSKEDVKQDILQGLSEKSSIIPGSHNKTFKITTQLAKIREENLSKKRGQMKQTKMQELHETSETESVKGSGGSMDSESGASMQEKPQPEVLPPAPSSNTPVFPSLPDEFLTRLGLHHKKGETTEIADQFTDQEVEEKFATLSLAFKTDKLTLDKRIDLHQRARDIAEQNIDREMDGLKEALKALSHFCTEPECRDVYSKIQHHVDILEQSTTRVSSRAEVHGAVQQELRMSKAIDVMVQHVDNLKRVQEREHMELEESKRLIHESRLGSNADMTGVESLLSKRSFSVAAGMPMKQAHQRSAHNPQTSGIKHVTYVTKSATPQANDSNSAGSDSNKGGRRRASVCVLPRAAASSSTDAKSKLQNLFTSVANKNNISLSYLERQDSLSALNLDTPRSANTSPGSPQPSPFNDSTSDESSFLPPSPGLTLRRRLTINNNEDCDREKTSVNGSLLPDQQPPDDTATQQHVLFDQDGLSAEESLLHQPDQDDEDYAEEEEDSGSDIFQETLLQRIKNKVRVPRIPTISATRVRYTIAGLLLFTAVVIVILTILPGSSALYSETSSKRSNYNSLEELFWSRVSVRHLNSPPPT